MAADDELALLVVHGVLHLLDYDHAEHEEAVVMRRREQELLAVRDSERDSVRGPRRAQIPSVPRARCRDRHRRRLWAFSACSRSSETAFVRVSRIRLLNLAEEGDKRAERLLRLLEHPEQTLNSMLLCCSGAR